MIDGALNGRIRKSVVLILDGLGDLPAPALDGQTPLEAAWTPVMDRLAGAGLYGLVDPEKAGRIPNTHTGCGILLGVMPEMIGRLKRGPVEASGAGRKLTPGDIAIRANFATLDRRADGLMIVDRRAGRIRSDTSDLAAALTGVDLGDGIVAELIPTDQHRCVLVLSGPGLDHCVGDTDPGDRGMPGFVQECIPRTAGADLTARKINRFVEIAYQRLSGHPLNQDRADHGELPANGVITRGAGAVIKLENVVRNRGVRAALVAGCNTVCGLAKALDFDVISNAGFTADIDTDVQSKMEAALTALEDHDLVYIHVKATDIFSHDHDPEGKRVFLERVDVALETLEKAGVLIAISADHSTDCNSGAHTADPVPALIYQPGRSGSTKPPNFGETACRSGTMARQDGHDFLLRLLGLMTES